MKPHERILFFIVMTGIWGLATVLLIFGFPLFIIDSLLGTEFVSFIDKNILSGGEIAFLKIWFCGLPASFLTDMHKKR